MTVSSPPSRPEPDGGETGSGSVRSPPSPSNNDNMSTSTTSSNQTQSTVEGTGIQKNTVKQVTPPKTTQVEIQQENNENKVQNSSDNLQIRKYTFRITTILAIHVESYSMPRLALLSFE